MQLVKDVYQEAIIHKQSILITMIDFLIQEKKVLDWEDPVSKLEHYLQNKFKAKMNEHLIDYMNKRKSKAAG